MNIITKVKQLISRRVNIPTSKDKSDLIVDEIRKNGGGGVVGDHVWIINSRIDMTTPALLHIGNNVTITEARILTHDACLYNSLHYSRVGKVVIGNNVFLGKQSIVLPGTNIGDNVIIGAGAVVGKNIPSNSVVIGNPCKILCSYDELLEKVRDEMETLPVINKYADELCTEDIETLLTSERGFIK